MSNANIDVCLTSNDLPPRPQTRFNNERARTSRSSTVNRILHGTLRSRSPSSSSSNIVHRKRQPSIQRSDRFTKSTSSSIINTRLRSSTVPSSINNSRSVENLQNDDDDDELDMESDSASITELTSQNQSNKENVISKKYPFEIDKLSSQKNTTLSGKKLSAEVYQLFEQQANGIYRCTLCLDQTKIIKQTGRGTANLRSHLLVHNLKNFAFKSQEEQRFPNTNKSSNNQINSIRKREIDQAILKCTIAAGLPFSLFNHDALIELLNILEPGYKPPDRGTISLRIQDQYHQHILDLQSILPHVGPIAFSSDVWKDISRQHIISLSLHTFSIDFDFISLPISFHRFNDQKLAVNIQAFFDYEKERFGLSTRILSGITTDNGPDIKCGASSGVLGPRFACLAHCFNLVVHHATCVWDLPNPKRFPFDSMYEPVNTSLIDDEDDEMTNEPSQYLLSASMITEENIPDRIAKQTTDYSAFDVDNGDVSIDKPASNQEVFNLLIRVHRLIHKVRAFVSMIRSIGPLQRYVCERLGPNEGSFILDVKVRWNSTYKMIKRLIGLRGLADDIFMKRDFQGLTPVQEKKLRLLVFTFDDWELLSALYDCLDPFDRATTILSGDYPTQSMSYFTLQTLKENVLQTFNPTYYHAIINKSLKLQSGYYLDEFLPSAQKIGMKVAAFLDPLFHGDLILNKEDYLIAKHVVIEGMQQMDLVAPDFSTTASSTTSTALSSTTNSDRMLSLKSSLMNIANKKASPPLSFQPVSVDLEMATFLNLIRDNELINFQTFWRTNSRALPRLSQIARRYNVIPATSVYLEQTFSVAGAIKNIRRASMSSLTLRSMMILKKKENVEKLRPFAPQQ